MRPAPPSSHDAEAPILLWALTHQTLVRTEVPILRQAGFEVVVQEPTDHLRGLDFIDYPDLNSSLSTDSPRVAAARDLGPRVRLGARGGRVTREEAEMMNWAFDAIMVADDRLADTQIPRWFDGTVLYRNFGNVPGRNRQERGPRSRLAARLVGVPLLSTLTDSRFERSLSRIQALNQVVPPIPPLEARGAIRGQSVSLYVGGVEAQTDFPNWLESFRSAVPASVEIRAFGSLGTMDQCYAELGMTVIGRLSSADYWAVFAATDLWVYPHEDPMHSHYIPLEAMSLGIPCLLTERTAVAAQVVRRLSGDPRSYGIVTDSSELGPLTAELLRSRDERREVVRLQRVLAEPFTEEAVLAQARALVRAVEETNASRRPHRRPHIGAEEIGPPSAAEFRSALAAGFDRPLAVCASSLAMNWRLWQTPLPRSTAVSSAHSDSRRLTQWQLRPGPDVSVPLGLLCHATRTRTAFRVDCELSSDSAQPIVLEVVDPDGRRSIALWTDTRSEDGMTLLGAGVDVRPEQSVGLRVVGAIVSHGLRVGSLRITPQVDTLPNDSFDSLGSSPLTTISDTDGCIQLWTVAKSVHRALGLSNITRGRIAVVHFALDLLRFPDSALGCHVQSPSPSGLASRAFGLVVVAARYAFAERPRLLVVRLGPFLLFQRREEIHSSTNLVAFGTRSSIMGLRAQYTYDAAPVGARHPK